MPRTREDIQAQGHDGYDIAEVSASAIERPETTVVTERFVLEPAGLS